MDEQLRDLVGQASTRVEARNAERQGEKARQLQNEQEKDAEQFRRKVESVLGESVLAAIGPVNFHKNFLSQYMTFEQDWRTFRLQQQTGFLVQLEENGNMLGHQFNLGNADSKDVFLHTLGTALKPR